jgi:hypothetical protein
MVKNVAGGRTEPRSVPGMKSAEVPAAVSSAASAAHEPAQTLIERASAARSPDEPGFRDFRRGFIEDVPICGNVSRRLLRRSAFPAVIGTQIAGLELMLS